MSKSTFVYHIFEAAPHKLPPPTVCCSRANPPASSLIWPWLCCIFFIIFILNVFHDVKIWNSQHSLSKDKCRSQNLIHRILVLPLIWSITTPELMDVFNVKCCPFTIMKMKGESLYKMFVLLIWRNSYWLEESYFSHLRYNILAWKYYHSTKLL